MPFGMSGCRTVKTHLIHQTVIHYPGLKLKNIILKWLCQYLDRGGRNGMAYDEVCHVAFELPSLEVGKEAFRVRVFHFLVGGTCLGDIGAEVKRECQGQPCRLPQEPVHARAEC